MIPPVYLTKQAEKYILFSWLPSLFHSLPTKPIVKDRNQALADSHSGMCVLYMQGKQKMYPSGKDSVCPAFLNFDLKDVFEISDFGLFFYILGFHFSDMLSLKMDTWFMK